MCIRDRLNAATVENGCLQIMPCSHRAGLHTHCPSGTSGLLIPEQFMNMDSARPLPIDPGDVLLLTQHTIHGSLVNESDDVRWSFDLRYNAIGQATGRDFFPGFVARSHKDPSSELRDPEAWAQSWYDTREKLSVGTLPPFNRWQSGDPACA